MSREDPQIKLRLPEEMKDRLAKVALENKRSMNAEIVARLGDSFRREVELETALNAPIEVVETTLLLQFQHVRDILERMTPLVEAVESRTAKAKKEPKK